MRERGSPAFKLPLPAPGQGRLAPPVECAAASGHAVQRQEPESSLPRLLALLHKKYPPGAQGGNAAVFCRAARGGKNKGAALQGRLGQLRCSKRTRVAQQGGNPVAGSARSSTSTEAGPQASRPGKFALPHLSKANNQTVNARKRNKYGVERCGGLCAHV